MLEVGAYGPLDVAALSAQRRAPVRPVAGARCWSRCSVSLLLVARKSCVAQHSRSLVVVVVVVAYNESAPPRRSASARVTCFRFEHIRSSTLGRWCRAGAGGCVRRPGTPMTTAMVSGCGDGRGLRACPASASSVSSNLSKTLRRRLPQLLPPRQTTLTSATNSSTATSDPRLRFVISTRSRTNSTYFDL